MKFFLIPRASSRPAAIVETLETITDQSAADLRALMYERNCANGMLFDPSTCITFRDTFEDEGPEAVREDLRLKTDDVLRLVEGATLDDRVETWLALLSASWNHALPPDESVAKLLQDFVPAALGTEIHLARSRK
jgi:hypothetical protein